MEVQKTPAVAPAQAPVPAPIHAPSPASDPPPKMTPVAYTRHHVFSMHPPRQGATDDVLPTWQNSTSVVDQLSVKSPAAAMMTSATTVAKTASNTGTATGHVGGPAAVEASTAANRPIPIPQPPAEAAIATATPPTVQKAAFLRGRAVAIGTMGTLGSTEGSIPSPASGHLDLTASQPKPKLSLKDRAKRLGLTKK